MHKWISKFLVLSFVAVNVVCAPLAFAEEVNPDVFSPAPTADEVDCCGDHEEENHSIVEVVRQSEPEEDCYDGGEDLAYSFTFDLAADVEEFEGQVDFDHFLTHVSSYSYLVGTVFKLE